MAADVHGCASGMSLLELPADGLADVVSWLSIPADVHTLMLVSRFFAAGHGRSILSVGAGVAAAKMLRCSPGEVSEITGAPAGEDAFVTATFVMRAHASSQPLACTNHTLAVRCGVLQSCGANESGQLGNGIVSQFSSTIYVPSPTYSSADYLARQQQVVEKHDTSVPAPVVLHPDVVPVCVAAGRSHSLMISGAGAAYSWGSNECGQLGHLPSKEGLKLATPQAVEIADDAFNVALDGLTLNESLGCESLGCLPRLAAPPRWRVVQVSAGETHSLFLLCTGQIFACGAGSNGEIGSGELEDAPTPRLVRLPQAALSISAGGFHSLALSAERSRCVYGWGSAACGQLGPKYLADGSHEAEHMRPTPTIIHGGPVTSALPPCAQLAAGLHHSLLLTQRGEVLAFGKGSDGALGLGERQDVIVPRKVMALDGKRIVQLAAAVAHSAFVTIDGELFTCGSVANGRLGVMPARNGPPLKYSSLPLCVPLPAGRLVRRVVAGHDHTLALMRDGSTYVFGRGQAGQLGCGDRKDQLALCRVTALEAPAFERLAKAGGGMPEHSSAQTSDAAATYVAAATTAPTFTPVTRVLSRW